MTTDTPHAPDVVDQPAAPPTPAEATPEPTAIVDHTPEPQHESEPLAALRETTPAEDPAAAPAEEPPAATESPAPSEEPETPQAAEEPAAEVPAKPQAADEPAKEGEKPR